MNITKPNFDFDEFMKELDQTADHPPKPLFTGGEDPIALSYAVYHNWLARGYDRWADFTSVKPTDADYTLAEETRQYYRHRYLMRGLTGRELTPFQQDLHSIVEGGPVLDSHSGLLYKLPYLYQEDIKLDEIYRSTVNNPDIRSEHLGTTTLTPLQSVYVCRRTGDVRQYWWKNEHDIAVCWPVLESNGLRLLLDSIHRRDEPIKLVASLKHSISRNFHQHNYYVLTQGQLA